MMILKMEQNCNKAILTLLKTIFFLCWSMIVYCLVHISRVELNMEESKQHNKAIISKVEIFLISNMTLSSISPCRFRFRFRFWFRYPSSFSVSGFNCFKSFVFVFCSCFIQLYGHSIVNLTTQLMSTTVNKSMMKLPICSFLGMLLEFMGKRIEVSVGNKMTV